MPLSDLNKETRQAGSDAARAHAANLVNATVYNVTAAQIESARRARVHVMREAFTVRLEAGLIPATAPF